MKFILGLLLNWMCPLGFQDDNGFHYGVPAPGQVTDEDTRYL